METEQQTLGEGREGVTVVMLKLSLPKPGDRPLQLLCLGAHADDIEIGCGGTILHLIETITDLEIYWVVFSSEGKRKQEAKMSAARFLRNAKKKTVLIKRFRGSFFPFRGEAIKECFEQLKEICQPDVVFTHYRGDLHQDHRVISDFTWNTWRNDLILEYEIPKYDGDLGSPNLFVPVSHDLCRKKTTHLLECFRTQADKPWFTEDTFMSLMRLRGIECNAAHKYAEAFYARKLVL